MNKLSFSKPKIGQAIDCNKSGHNSHCTVGEGGLQKDSMKSADKKDYLDDAHTLFFDSLTILLTLRSDIAFSPPDPGFLLRFPVC